MPGTVPLCVDVKESSGVGTKQSALFDGNIQKLHKAKKSKAHFRRITITANAFSTDKIYTTAPPKQHFPFSLKFFDLKF